MNITIIAKSKIGKNLNDPMISISLKNDMNGGSPMLKAQLINHTIESSGEITENPFKIIVLRECITP
jgi:hypothetical protein